MKKWKSRLMIISGVLLFVFLCGYVPRMLDSNPRSSHQFNKDTTKPPKSARASYILSANQLYSEYDNNEVAADFEYKGKIVIVSGIIQDIGKTIGGNAYIIIGGSGFLDGVQCIFQTNWQSSVARLSKGQYVKVKGKVSGKFGNVIIRKCSYRSVFRKEIE